MLEKTIELFKHILENINRLSFSKKYISYPALQSVVCLSNGKEVIEDFFNLRMTVALPRWTARFQNTIFRSFTEKLFIDNSPAHLRLDFRWLPVDEMKKFEELYFKWLNALYGQTIELRGTADDLITFLYRARY